MLTDFFRLAFRNIAHRKRRSWLTILGTLIGIMAVVSLVSIGQGLENSIQGEFEKLGGNKVIVSPGGGFSSRFTGTTIKLTEEDIEVISNTRGVADVEGQIAGSVLLKYGDTSKYVSVIGTKPNAELIQEFLSIEMEEGRYLRPNDRSNVVIGSSLSNDVFDRKIGLRNRVSINGEEFQVVGIVGPAGNPNMDRGVLMPMERAREVLDKPEAYDNIVVEVEDGFEPSEVEQNIDHNLRQARDVQKGEEDFDTQTAQDIIESFTNQLAIVRAVIVGIGAISLFVGGVGIMNTMYTSVTERTRDIGVMKAVGATTYQIMAVFLIESGLIGAVGGLLGATLGIGISYLATTVITQQIGFSISPYVSPELVVGSILFSFIIGMVSGVMPARKAAKLKPVEALRYS